MMTKRTTYRILCQDCGFARDTTNMSSASAYMFNHAIANEGHALFCESWEPEV